MNATALFYFPFAFMFRMGVSGEGEIPFSLVQGSYLPAVFFLLTSDEDDDYEYDGKMRDERCQTPCLPDDLVFRTSSSASSSRVDSSCCSVYVFLHFFSWYRKRDQCALLLQSVLNPLCENNALSSSVLPAALHNKSCLLH